MSAPAEAPAASLPLLLAFCRAVETGSFTGAARALHLRPAAVSRAIARLEEQLGVPLFRRSTRSLRPTPAALRYYEQVAPALAQLAQAEAALADDAAPRGRVRVSLPTTWGLHRLIPLLAGFDQAHPDIALDLCVSNHVVDFVREGYDLAVRLGPIEDASLVARRLEDAPLGVFASPAYLARRGAPDTVEALAGHTLLPFVLPRAGRVLPWLFAAPDQEIVPDGPHRVFEDPQAVIGLAVAGLGLCQTYRFMVARELARGALVEVLADRAGRTRRFALVYPRQGQSPAARAVAAWIMDHRSQGLPDADDPVAQAP